MRRYEWIGLATGVLLAYGTATIPARAQAPAASPKSGPAELRDQVSKLGFELLRARAEGAEIDDEDQLLSAARTAEWRSLSAQDDNLWKKTIARTIQTPGVLVNLAALLKSIEQDQVPAHDAWLEAMDKSQRFREEDASLKARLGNASRSTGGLIAQGIFAVLGGVILTTHEIRDRLRWRLRALGSRPSLILIAIALPMAAALGAAPGAEEAGSPPPPAGSPEGSGADVDGDLARRRAVLRKQLDETQQANIAALQRLALRLEEVRQARATLALKPNTPAQEKFFHDAEQLEQDVQEQFRKIRVSARLTAGVAREANRLQEELKNDTRTQTAFALGRIAAARQEGFIRLATCLLMIGAAIVPLTLVRRRRRRELNEMSQMCPRCLNKGTLDFDTMGSEPGEGTQVKFRKKVCGSCDYEIRENYIRENRLCFPTVGIRESGKTHWMLMLYDMIKNSDIPVASTIKKIPSREDARFDELVRRLLYEGGRLDPTVLGLPHPLTFHVHDTDPLGPNKTMVNLFDFSGEMRNFDIDTNEFRRRALRCEGFTLFLDPVQVTNETNLTIEDQIQTLAQFAEEMHAIRGLASETPIDLPIAVCVSKMDLLVNKNPMGTQAIELVTALRETLTRKVDLALIHERSQLCARAMPLMFPGWNVERTLRENFGGRYMFFPMSAVGLEGAELGVEDLSKRTITPLGMIEPLLWLLHMHGYCVLH